MRALPVLAAYRNTFQQPELVGSRLRLKNAPNIRFAGQITGVEGYVESTTIGLMAGHFAAAQIQGRAIAAAHDSFWALLAHITVNADAIPTDECQFRTDAGYRYPTCARRRRRQRLRGKLRMQAKKQARQRALPVARSDFESWHQAG